MKGCIWNRPPFCFHYKARIWESQEHTKQAALQNAAIIAICRVNLKGCRLTERMPRFPLLSS
jgi:hypothetical protein